MSAKLDIFNDIVTELDKIKEIETKAIWNNQFDNETEETSFNYPVVFIEFATIPWDVTSLRPPRLGSEGNKRKEQKAPGTIITLHIGFSKLEDQTQSFIENDPLLDKVYFAIQDLTGDFYTPLLRVAERQDTDHDRVIDWQMDFTTQMSQCGELDTSLTEIPGSTLDLDVGIVLDIDNDIIRTGDGKV